MATAVGQLVRGVIRDGLAGTLTRQLAEASLDLAPHPTDSDPEHALATLHQVEDLIDALERTRQMAVNGEDAAGDDTPAGAP